MRIAVVTTSWPRFDGDPSGHFVETEVRALTQCGEVEVIAADAAAFGWPGFVTRVRESPLRLGGAAAWVLRARARVAGGGFDRIVAHWAVPSAWPVVPASGAGARARLEVVSHGGDVRLLAALPAPLRDPLVKRIATRAERWRFVSRALQNELLDRLGRDVARAVESIAYVKPCDVDVIVPSAEAIAEKRARVGAPFAVCVARLVSSKRVDAAIGWAKGRGLALVIVGDGPERAALERVARASGGRVLFVGRTSRYEALAWIAGSVEVVQASRAEGASTVEREAESLGVPVAVIG